MIFPPDEFWSEGFWTEGFWGEPAEPQPPSEGPWMIRKNSDGRTIVRRRVSDK